MAFKIQDLKKPTINTKLKKTLSHEGLEVTLCIKNDPAFQNALIWWANRLTYQAIGKNLSYQAQSHQTICNIYLHALNFGAMA